MRFHVGLALLVAALLPSLARADSVAAAAAHSDDDIEMEGDCGSTPTCVAQKFADALGRTSPHAVRLDALVTFEPGRVRVYSESRDRLQALASAWKRQANRSTLVIEGHAGSRQDLALAQKRADKIRGYLIRYGVPPEHVMAIGHDERADAPAIATGRVDLIVEHCETGTEGCPRHPAAVARRP